MRWRLPEMSHNVVSEGQADSIQKEQNGKPSFR